MLGLRSFYCIFNNNEIFEFQSKKQRDEMYSHECQFISAADVYKKKNMSIQPKSHIDSSTVGYRLSSNLTDTFSCQSST